MIHNAPNVNHLWSRLIVEELRRNGVDTFYISPGSRSTPLTVAAAQTEGVQTYVHFDERGSAFAAMGHAMGSGRPTALSCTSGSGTAQRKAVFFERRELNQLLNMYTRRVMTGEWRDYAIDYDATQATFSIYRHAAERPLFAITKLGKSQGKGKGRFLLTSGPAKLKQGQTMDEVIAALEAKLRVVWTNG